MRLRWERRTQNYVYIVTYYVQCGERRQGETAWGRPHGAAAVGEAHAIVWEAQVGHDTMRCGCGGQRAMRHMRREGTRWEQAFKQGR